jgi:hypothetical protein
MTILVCEPNKPPYAKDIKGELEEMQAIVGGLIEPVQVREDILILCNEEGLIYDLPRNRFNLCGTIFFVGRKKADFIGLTRIEILECISIVAKWDVEHQ